MAHSPGRKTTHRKTRRRSYLTAIIRDCAHLCWRLLRVVQAAPPSIQVFVGVIVILGGWYSVNWAYQVYHKPTEMFFPLSGALTKSPSETWEEYGPLFREHSTAVITPEFLAALAQAEGGGNPIAQTYWRWRLTWNPLEMYQPASSAVGMYQITDGTFQEAKRYCIHDHLVVEDGPWNDLKSCWFNSLYTRVMPSHAIEMTAALLERNVGKTMKRQRIPAATLRQKQSLAAVIHLCGLRVGDAYAKRRFQVTAGQRCGNHRVADYLAKINAMKRQFAKLAVAVSVP